MATITTSPIFQVRIQSTTVPYAYNEYGCSNISRVNVRTGTVGFIHVVLQLLTSLLSVFPSLVNPFTLRSNELEIVISFRLLDHERAKDLFATSSSSFETCLTRGPKPFLRHHPYFRACSLLMESLLWLFVICNINLLCLLTIRWW